MISVGFRLDRHNAEWIGGYNYFRNLISAVSGLSDRKIEPVIITRLGGSLDLKGFPNVRILESKVLTRSTFLGLLRGGLVKLGIRDFLFEAVLKQNHIRAISHVSERTTSMPTLGWIADFQHKHLTEFFTAAELAQRDGLCERACSGCDLVLVSSEVAANDLRQFYPQYASKARVLHFVANPNIGNPEQFFAQPASPLSPGKFFILPNQFWAHKNHKIVVAALGYLKSNGKEVTVLATGATHDRRNPDFFDSLMKSVQEIGVEHMFKPLGMVSYEDLSMLMRDAVAFINPSLFEGWSTSVEEAKSMGKAIALSDLEVHREQAPSRGTFFNPKSPEELANVLWGLWETFDPDEDRRLQAEAITVLKERQDAFAKQYESIVLDLVASKS